MMFNHVHDVPEQPLKAKLQGTRKGLQTIQQQQQLIHDVPEQPLKAKLQGTRKGLQTIQQQQLIHEHVLSYEDVIKFSIERNSSLMIDLTSTMIAP